MRQGWKKRTHVLLVHFTLETVSWRTSSGAASAQTKSIANGIYLYFSDS